MCVCVCKCVCVCGCACVFVCACACARRKGEREVCGKKKKVARENEKESGLLKKLTWARSKAGFSDGSAYLHVGQLFFPPTF